MAKTRILKNDAELKRYMEWVDLFDGVMGMDVSKFRFASVEVRKWYNPMRLIHGDYYYKVLKSSEYGKNS